jgi:hypothetical protein
MLTFPASSHDDQVDALGLVGQLLDRMVAGTRTQANKPKPRDRWRDDDDAGEVSWKTA